MLGRSRIGAPGLITLLAASMLTAINVHAQGRLPGDSSPGPAGEPERPLTRPWWIAVELGDGQLKLTSGQFTTTSPHASPTSTGSRGATFEFGLAGGHRLGNHARIGMDVDGWLLQAFPLNDPAKGESVTNVLGIVDLFPIRKIPLFVRAGGGLALYTNDRPLEFGGTGWAWTAGGGYEFSLPIHLGLAAIADFDSGSRGDVHNVITVETGRRYSVAEFKLAFTWHFGKASGS